MFPQLGMMEMLVVMGVAVLLFGKRLPEVGRSLGKGIVEFKKGLRGIEDEFDISAHSSSVPARRARRSAPPRPLGARRDVRPQVRAAHLGARAPQGLRAPAGARLTAGTDAEWRKKDDEWRLRDVPETTRYPAPLLRSLLSVIGDPSPPLIAQVG